VPVTWITAKFETNKRLNTEFLESEHGSFEFVHNAIRYNFVESVPSDLECYHFLVYKSKKNFILVEPRSSISLDELQEDINGGSPIELHCHFDNEFIIQQNAHDVFDTKPITIDWDSIISSLEYKIKKEKYDVEKEANQAELKVMKKRQAEHGNTFEFVAHYYRLLPVRK